MKIRKGGKPPKDPQTTYGCSECGEFFTSPKTVSIHCLEMHNLNLSGEESKKIQYDVTPTKFKEMKDHETQHAVKKIKTTSEKTERSYTKLSQDPASDLDEIIKSDDLTNPDATFKKLVDLLESPDTSKPLPGIFKIDIEGSQIRLIVALKLQNTAANMSAIGEFNHKIS